MTSLEDEILGLMGGDDAEVEGEKNQNNNKSKGTGQEGKKKKKVTTLADSSEDEDEDEDEDDERVGGGDAMELDEDEDEEEEESSSDEDFGERKKKKKTKKKSKAIASRKRKQLDSDDSDDDDVSFSSDEDEEDDEEEDEEDEDEDEIAAVPLKKRGKKKTADEDANEDDDDDDDESIDFNLSDYDDGYGSDLMGDSEDRERLLAMNELDREMELYERQEKRDELRRQKEIMLKLKEEQDRKREAKKRKTRSQSKRATTKKTPKDKRKNALSELLARRDKKKSTREALQSMRGDYDDGQDEYDGYDDYAQDYSDDDYYSEEDDRRTSKKSRRKKRADLEDGELEDGDFEASFDDLKSIVITRNRIVNDWYKEPFFEDVMENQFLKMQVDLYIDNFTGEEKSAKRLVRVCRVFERKAGNHRIPFSREEWIKTPYEIDGVRMSWWAEVRIGKGKVELPLLFVSNGELRESDFEAYCEQCRKDGERQPMRSDCRNARVSQENAKNFRYSAADVAKLIEKKRGSRKTANYAAEKQRLASLRDWAKDQGDEEKVGEYEKQLETLQKEHREKMIAAQKKRMGLSAINKKNVEKNFEKMMSYSKVDRKNSIGKADPFSRRPTAPANYWRTKNKKESEDSKGEVVKKEDKSAKTTPEKIKEGDLSDLEEESHGQFPGIDLTFKVDVSLLDRQVQRRRLSLKTKQGLPPNTKSLSITDYFKRLDETGAVQ